MVGTWGLEPQTSTVLRLIYSLQQLESPIGSAQTLANTRKTTVQWIEERIGSLSRHFTARKQFTMDRVLIRLMRRWPVDLLDKSELLGGRRRFSPIATTL